MDDSTADVFKELRKQIYDLRDKCEAREDTLKWLNSTQAFKMAKTPQSGAVGGIDRTSDSSEITRLQKIIAEKDALISVHVEALKNSVNVGQLTAAQQRCDLIEQRLEDCELLLEDRVRECEQWAKVHRVLVQLIK
jgi:hypothetical protein